MPATRKLTLTWCLFKDGIDTDDADALIEEPETGRLESYKIGSLHRTRDSLFIKRTAAVPPGWVSLLVGHIPDNDLRRLVGGSSSAVLLVPAGNRLLAVTFGYGRFLVRDEAIDQDFGLKLCSTASTRRRSRVSTRARSTSSRSIPAAASAAARV
jgi:uncharacterized protein (TIGR04141 family)